MINIRENKLKSVLCMPLMYQGDISKILYIENDLSTGAFTEDRVEFLKSAFFTNGYINRKFKDIWAS